MNRGIRGAASVSVIWVIVLIVIVLAAGGGLYILASERSKWESDVALALRDKESADARYVAIRTQNIELSKQVGYRDDTDPNAMSNWEQIQAAVKQLQENHAKDGVGPDASNLARVVERLGSRIDDLNRELSEAKTQSSSAQKDRESINAQLADMTRQKDDAFNELQKQLTDERDRNASQEAADKTRIEDLNKRLTDQEARARSEKEELEKKVAVLEGDVRHREGRITELQKKVEYVRLPDEPDGSIVATTTADSCYVDLGARNLLRRGTRFKVFTYGKGGAMREKGMIEITSVDETMSEATVVDLKDRFDPIARGDKIAAPNYDPKMPREFVLVGRFPTGYSRAMVADRLRQLGATVSEKVGPTTDFLVMGDRDEAAAAGGEEGGEATEAEPTAESAADSEDIKLAQLYRVQILPVREILEFLKYE